MSCLLLVCLPYINQFNRGYNAQTLRPLFQKNSSQTAAGAANSIQRCISSLKQQDSNLRRIIFISTATRGSEAHPEHTLPNQQAYILSFSISDSTSSSVISASKMLRQHAKINEEKTCAKCPFKHQCPHAKIPNKAPIENSPKQLLIFWSGLNNLLKPQDIYFRQWTSAYKLGDSIIAGLNDLAQGGKQIEEYERLRIQTVKAYAQKTKNTQQKSSKSQEKPSKEKLEKIQKELNEKFKIIQKITQQTVEKQQDQNPNIQKFGRDYSFDQQEQFEPKAGFTKDNFQEKPAKKQQKSLKTQKGYQTIENTEQEKPKYQSFERKEHQNKPKFTPNKASSNERSYSNQRHNNYDRPKNYERKGENVAMRDYDSFSEKYQKNKYGSNKKSQDFDNYQPRKNDKNRYNYQDQGSKYSNFNQKQKYNNRNERDFNQERSNNKFTKNQRSNSYDEKPRKNYQNKEDRQEPYQQRQQNDNSHMKPNPFVSKWNSESTPKPRDNNKYSQPKFSENGTKNYEPKQYKVSPKIIEMQENDSQQQSERRVGRNIRRRSQSNSGSKDPSQN